VFIEAKDDEGGGDNWTTGAISCAKLQSNHHHQQTYIQFLLQAGCPSCRPTKSVKAGKRTNSVKAGKRYIKLGFFTYIIHIVTFTKKVMFSLAFVCLFVS